MNEDEFLRSLAVGGATRADSFSGMNEQFRSSLARMLQEAPPDLRGQIQIKSGYRSPERQAQLWAGALKKYGSPERARKWVAPPGNSQHNHGFASDLAYGSDAARKWAHANAQRYGLQFPLSNENWHIELVGARDGNFHAPQPAVTRQEPTSVADAYGVIPTPAADRRVSLLNPPTNVAVTTPTATPVAINQAGVPEYAPDGSLGSIVGLFAQQQAVRRKAQREEEEKAEQMRRAALFSPDAIARLYG